MKVQKRQNRMLKFNRTTPTSTCQNPTQVQVQYMWNSNPIPRLIDEKARNTSPLLCFHSIFCFTSKHTNNVMPNDEE